MYKKLQKRIILFDNRLVNSLQNFDMVVNAVGIMAETKTQTQAFERFTKFTTGCHSGLQVVVNAFGSLPLVASL
jgi:spore coat polysaccharide biosynthesis predicted glycosyltransferase SpsG